jgi:CheY-like chemotaxis protein
MATKKLLVVEDDHTELVVGISNRAIPQTDKREKAAGRTPLMADTGKGESSSKSNPAHILLVEDREIDQKVATGYLKVWGYKVDLAVNGREAIEMVAKTDYDLMLMDIQMPQMDGLTATAAIREAETTRRLPIIALTARAMKGDRERCIAAGMDGYLTKPIRFKTLRAILDSHLRPRKN